MSFLTNEYLPGVVQVPSSLELVAATCSYPMQLTVSVDQTTARNTYREGQLIKMTIPFGYGMQQANGLVGRIIEVVGTTFYLDVDSRLFDPFSVPSSGQKPASIACYGSRNLEFDNETRRVPFQSFNNVGN